MFFALSFPTLEELLGAIAVFFYSLVLMPQIVNGLRNQSLEGLSLATLLLWTLGDLTNLISGFLLDQIFSVKATAALFVSIDSFTILLFLYYERWKRPNERLYQFKITIYRLLGILVIPSPISAASSLNLIDGKPEFYDQQIIGSTLAWICAIFYFGSRIPQIYMLYKRHRVFDYEPIYEEESVDIVLEDEVRPVKFNYYVWVFMVCANICYSTSLIMAETRKDFDSSKFLCRTLPYLIGSGGTIPLDLFILYIGKQL
eukprot:NODE_40_length_35084_cov_0.543519.p15 type:complete len:258 gc:universal NODE_40_length_35084_cov_0.543519:29082-28309(-)